MIVRDDKDVVNDPLAFEALAFAQIDMNLVDKDEDEEIIAIYKIANRIWESDLEAKTAALNEILEKSIDMLKES